jgi:hypothetical protein
VSHCLRARRPQRLGDDSLGAHDHVDAELPADTGLPAGRRLPTTGVRRSLLRNAQSSPSVTSAIRSRRWASCGHSSTPHVPRDSPVRQHSAPTCSEIVLQPLLSQRQEVSSVGSAACPLRATSRSLDRQVLTLQPSASSNHVAKTVPDTRGSRSRSHINEGNLGWCVPARAVPMRAKRRQSSSRTRGVVHPARHLPTAHLPITASSSRHHSVASR